MLEKIWAIVVGMLFFNSSCQAQSVTENVLPIETGNVTKVSSMQAERASHTSTLLKDGRVLITGGFVSEDNILESTEIFDVRTATFKPTENMRVKRSSHTATLLPNGKVLIAGGFNGDYLDSAEIFDPKTNRFESAGKMVSARSNHVAVLLKNGKVLLAGGVGTGWTFLSSAEIYDPETNTFINTGKMISPRESHTITLLANGKVLITGGHRGRRSEVEIYSDAEIYDPATEKFNFGGKMTVKRHKHEAVLLKDNRILILGGSDERDSHGAYRNAEIFNPANGKSTAINNMNSTRYKLQGTAVNLANGKILVAGGAERVEVFNPETDSFSYAGGTMGEIKLFAAATLLQNGKVLITGGYNSRIKPTSDAWVYEI